MIIDAPEIEKWQVARSLSISSREETPCCGIRVIFPPGQNEHVAYPFALHSELSVPWNYHSVDNQFFLQSKSCARSSVQAGNFCAECRGIRSNVIYMGIIKRIEYGMNENTRFAYQPIGGLINLLRRKAGQVRALRLTKLNDNRKFLGKAAALEDHKQWIMAVASGRVDRVASLVQAGLRNHAGVRGLIAQYERAALQLYRPRGYTEEDVMRSIVMLRLGGARVADFAHRSMSLPGPSTARRNTVIRSLIVSASKPTVSEVELNLLLCLDAMSNLESDGESSQTRNPIMHQVLMFDEIAVEKRARWDDKSNMFLGACREHSAAVPLEFCSEKELGMFCDALDSGEIHLASEVCMKQYGGQFQLICRCQATVGALRSLSKILVNIVSGLFLSQARANMKQELSMRESLPPLSPG
jgi:hypothetical protein